MCMFYYLFRFAGVCQAYTFSELIVFKLILTPTWTSKPLYSLIYRSQIFFQSYMIKYFLIISKVKRCTILEHLFVLFWMYYSIFVAIIYIATCLHNPPAVKWAMQKTFWNKSCMMRKTIKCVLKNNFPLQYKRQSCC